MTACAAPTGDEAGTADVTIAGEMLVVAIADTSAARAQGLAGVDDLASGLDGMLFVYQEPRDANFNMRNVRFDLDIWWFDAEGNLIGTSRMEECLDGGCVSYPAPAPIGWALETRAGVFDFETGSVLTIP